MLLLLVRLNTNPCTRLPMSREFRIFRPITPVNLSRTTKVPKHEGTKNRLFNLRSFVSVIKCHNARHTIKASVRHTLGVASFLSKAHDATELKALQNEAVTN